MQYEHRELSEEKAEQLNAMRFTNMYGSVEEFDDWECVVTGDESVVFTQIGNSHEDDIPNQYFLEYHGWYFYVYSFKEALGAEPNGEGLDLKKLNRITHIIEVNFDRTKEELPAIEVIVSVLKEVIPIWNQYHSGRVIPGDRIVTEVRYEGEGYE